MAKKFEVIRGGKKDLVTRSKDGEHEKSIALIKEERMQPTSFD